MSLKSDTEPRGIVVFFFSTTQTIDFYAIGSGQPCCRSRRTLLSTLQSRVVEIISNVSRDGHLIWSAPRPRGPLHRV